MPNWSHTVPNAAIKHGYDLRRTPPDRPLRAVITCNELLGCYTHWWSGRTVPCESPHCPACEENTPARWHAYVSCFDPKTHEVFLFECTACAARALEHYYNSFGSLRGCLFTATRPKRRRNAKIEILTQPADLSNLTLPQPPNLEKALAIIWQIPANAIDTNQAVRGAPLVNLRQEVMDKTRDPANNRNGRSRKPQKETAVP
jgi:hypothetical protein